jgi:hypothetical protein
MEIGLRVCTLGLVLLGEHFPLLLSGGAAAETHYSSVRQALEQEEAGHGVFILPFRGHVDFPFRGVPGVLWLRARLLASEVHPPMHDFHRIPEAHCKDGPVGTIWLEIGNGGGESFNGRHDVAGVSAAVAVG